MRAKLAKLTPALMLALFVLLCAGADLLGASPASAPEDPVLRAMKIELDRSKSKLKLEQMAAPYYIEYQIVDTERRTAEAAYGALRSDVHMRLRFLRVVVRVGDYKQDSYFKEGEGSVDFAPLDDDELALRDQLWLATDRAYKSAISALAAKQAQLKQLKIDEPVDDFAHADPVQYLEPLARLDGDDSPWPKTLQEATALYKTDPEVQSMTAALEFRAANRYFVNSEGSIVRTGATIYQTRVEASAQASDGMPLSQSHSYTVTDLKELPTAEKFRARATETVGKLKDLRAAPLADEEYRGPVLFSSAAASEVFAELVGWNIRGLRPNLGQPARTQGAFASNYKSRVLPDFISVTDDPTLTLYNGKSLLGHYAVDDEGVKAMRVLVIEKGNLVNYLLGRQPIRDFPNSNGHGRAPSPASSPQPAMGNLIVTASETVPQAELKKKLIDLCQQRELPYGYYVDTVSGLRTPSLLYKVWAKDGHEELIRGAVFEDLDVRSLRNDLIAAGDDMTAWNSARNPQSMVNPSILFDELEVKRSDRNKSALPEYPPPPIAPAQ
jgi:predicted Zn-dependent protease